MVLLLSLFVLFLLMECLGERVNWLWIVREEEITKEGMYLKAISPQKTIIVWKNMGGNWKKISNISEISKFPEFLVNIENSKNSGNLYSLIRNLKFMVPKIWNFR